VGTDSASGSGRTGADLFLWAYDDDGLNPTNPVKIVRSSGQLQALGGLKVATLSGLLKGKAGTVGTVTIGNGLTYSDPTLSVNFGTTSTTVAAGNHTHTGVYEPHLGTPSGTTEVGTDDYVLTCTEGSTVRAWRKLPTSGDTSKSMAAGYLPYATGTKTLGSTSISYNPVNGNVGIAGDVTATASIISSGRGVFALGGSVEAYTNVYAGTTFIVGRSEFGGPYWGVGDADAPVTITIPKLTESGTNGSITIRGGIITAATNPT